MLWQQRYKHCKDFTVHTMKANGGRSVIRAVLTFTLDGVERSASSFGHFTSRKEPRYPLNNRQSGPPSWSEHFGKVAYLFYFGLPFGVCCTARGWSGGCSTHRISKKKIQTKRRKHSSMWHHFLFKDRALMVAYEQQDSCDVNHAVWYKVNHM
jgi:hypothetical protein